MFGLACILESEWILGSCSKYNWSMSSWRQTHLLRFADVSHFLFKDKMNRLSIPSVSRSMCLEIPVASKTASKLAVCLQALPSASQFPFLSTWLVLTNKFVIDQSIAIFRLNIVFVDSRIDGNVFWVDRYVILLLEILDELVKWTISAQVNVSEDHCGF